MVYDYDRRWWDGREEENPRAQKQDCFYPRPTWSPSIRVQYLRDSRDCFQEGNGWSGFTREEYVEKSVNIRTKIEEEEKEKLQKLQQEEDELQAQKRKKRKVKGNPRLSFAEDIENGSEEEDDENIKHNQLTATSNLMFYATNFEYWKGTNV